MAFNPALAKRLDPLVEAGLSTPSHQQVPFGYRLQRAPRDSRNRGITNWVLEEDEAVIVCDIFQKRRHGMSLMKIAEYLNGLGIATRQESRDGTTRWRASTVRHLIEDPIYKGVLIGNGNRVTQAKARKGRSVLSNREHPRPDLRIVHEETWRLCNQCRASRIGD